MFSENICPLRNGRDYYLISKNEELYPITKLVNVYYWVKIASKYNQSSLPLALLGTRESTGANTSNRPTKPLIVDKTS